MSKDTNKEFIKFFRTASATTKVLIYLIKDLAPVIGLGEAQRLVDIIDKAQDGEEE